MTSIFDYITVFIYLCTRQYWGLFLIMYAISHVVYVYYFWVSGAKFPILGVLPFARAFLYRSLSGINLALVIFYCLFSAAAWYLPSLLLWAIWLIFSFVLELQFARSCIDDKQVLYALCPPYKLIRLVLDANSMRLNESEV